jgi:PPOX class probable F420-dependent enzyme
VPAPPLPREADEFLRRPNPAVFASQRPDGTLHTAPTWYDWEEGRALVNLDASRRRLRYIRRNPRVALSVLDDGNWYKHLSLIGHVDAIERDPDLRDVDRLAVRYTGNRYRDRERESWSVWIAVDEWHGWERGRPWPR